MKISKASDYLGKIVDVIVDRLMGHRHPKYGFIYPLNYGYVPNTISGDGEELDAYLLGVFEPVSKYEKGKVIAYIHRTNDDDDKLIVVPNGCNYNNDQIIALTEFQERFFKSEIYRA